MVPYPEPVECFLALALAAFGRAPVEAVVVLQLVKRPVVESQRHVVFRAVCPLPAQVHGVVDDPRDAWAGGVVYGHLRRGAQVVDSLVVLGSFLSLSIK